MEEAGNGSLKDIFKTVLGQQLDKDSAAGGGKLILVVGNGNVITLGNGGTHVEPRDLGEADRQQLTLF